MILKRADGKRVAIHVYPFVSSGEPIKYRFEVLYCPPGKIKYLEVFDQREYQNTPYEQRAAFLLQKQLEHVTREEIYQAKLAAWQSMKPTL